MTTIAARGPSQLLVVWLTYQVVEPMAVVGGTGAVDDPTPPVAVVYHNKDPVPVAVNGVAVCPRQSCTGDDTPGAVGSGLTTTLTGTLGLSQLLASDWLTYQVKVPVVLVEGVGAVGLPVPPVGAVYQRRFVPVAVSGDAVSPLQ